MKFQILSLFLASMSFLCAQIEYFQLDVSSGFNTDNWVGYREYQALRTDGATDIEQAQGGSAVTSGQGRRALDAFNYGMIGNIDQTTANVLGVGLNDGVNYYGYSESGGGFETGATPIDGVLTGLDRVYHIASHGGNATLPGDWLEAADVSFVGSAGSVTSNMATQFNAMSIYTGHNRSNGANQIASTTATLAPGQQQQYDNINFILGGWDTADGARNGQIVAIYADDSEEILFSFDTAEGKIGPVADDSIADVVPPDTFSTVSTFSRGYNVANGATGGLGNFDWSLFEFTTPLDLDESKVLKAIRLEDSNATLNWNERGLSIYGVTASVVPEPSTYALALGGLIALTVFWRRKK